MKLFELFATLSLDTTSFSKGVGKATQTAQGLANTLSQKVSAGTIALGHAMYDVTRKGVAMLANLSKTAVQSAAEVRAENAQFESTFKDLQGAATSVFKGIGRETNILSTRLRGVGTKAFAQFTGAGMKGADAMAAMERYTKLAADAAAYYDISLEDADTRLRSFLRGNTEAGDAIGLFTSESQRNSYAVEMYGKKWNKLTEEQRNMLLLKVAEDIYKQSGAIGQAARESSNWANVTANLQEVWRQTLGVIGAPVVDALTPMVEMVTAKLQEPATVAAIETFAAKVGEIAGATFDSFMTLLEVISGDTSGVQEGGTLDNILTFVRDISAWVNQNKELVIGFFGSLAIAMLGVNAPVVLLIAGVALLAANWETIKTAVTAAWDAIVGFFGETVPDAFKQMLETIKSAWESISTFVQNAWDGLVGFFTETVPEAFKQMLENIKTWWNDNVVTPINNAISALNSFFGFDGKSITVSANVQAAASIHEGATALWGDGLAADLATQNAMSYSSPDSPAGAAGQAIGNWLSSLFGRATGQDYVPYDNFVARLHEGEAVLTKAEATEWRRGGSRMDMSQIGPIVAAAVREGLQGISVNMSGEKVGDLVTDRVSRNIAQAAWEERYST
jgi:hypothetical protein